jgi:DNA polymerase-3 subunit epsilon
VEAGTATSGIHATVGCARVRPAALAPRLSAEERVAHAAFIATLGENAIWCEYSAIPQSDLAAPYAASA